MSRLIVVPCAQLVSSELQFEFGAIPSGMIPAGGKPVLDYIASRFSSKGDAMIVAAHENVARIQEWIASAPSGGPTCVDVGHTSSIAQTVLNVLQEVARNGTFGPIVVNFSDTLVLDEPEKPNVVFVQNQQDTYRWTTVTYDQDLTLTSLKEKDRPSSTPAPVIAGVFFIEDGMRFMDLLKAELLGAKPNDGPVTEPFYRTLFNYMNAVPKSKKAFQVANEWLDFGHIDTYQEARRTVFLNRRFFNQIQIDVDKGVLKKTSEHKAKLIEEIGWYRSLPPTLQHISPRVIGFSVASESPYVELEYYGYPALSDMYVHGDGDFGLWSRIWAAAQRVVALMHGHVQRVSPTVHRALLYSMYVEKTLQRIEAIPQDGSLEVFFQYEMLINGRKCVGLRWLVSNLERLVEGSPLLSPRDLAVTHGDLCLSNILYDRRSGCVRLVDPRGSFGVPGIYGDPNYDLAKLLHSVDGDYDFITAGLYRAKTVGHNGYEYELRTREYHRMIKDALFDAFKFEVHELRALRLVEALLFVSMVPLHADWPARQAMFLARGLELLTSYVAESV